MSKQIRINAILHIRNFDYAFRGAFSSNWGKNDRLSKENLAKNIYSDYQSTKSESECELLSGSSFGVENLVKEVSDCARDLLVLSEDSVCVRMEQYKKWKRLSLSNGQDIFITAIINKNKKYDWPFALRAKSSALDSALSMGYAENHCHFNSAGPSFLVNWVLLHNGSPYDSSIRLLNKKRKIFEEYYSSEKYIEFKNIALLSIYLRRYLYSLCKQRYDEINKTKIRFNTNKLCFSDFKRAQPSFISAIDEAIKELPCGSCIKGLRFADYACDGIVKEALYGERVLLHNCFRNFNAWTRPQKMHFYLYLLCRKYILGFFCQNNLLYGFRNFKRFERMGDLFIPDNKLIRYETSRSVYKVLLESQELSKLEIRLAPKNSYRETCSRIDDANPFLLTEKFKTIESRMPMRYRNIKYGTVLHFVKKSRRFFEDMGQTIINVQPRCYEKIKEYERQSKIIKKYALLHSSKNFPLVGIDAANEEIQCRPELFASCYRELRSFEGTNYRGEYVHSGLKFTFHCGEDFVTLADGIRSVYEAILFLELNDGDRIGHASSIGVDVGRYFTLKGDLVSQTKQDLLDDLCFLYIANRESVGSYEIELYLNKQIISLLLEIYESNNVDSYLRAFLLKRDHPMVHHIQNKANDYQKKTDQFRCEGHSNYVADLINSTYAAAWMDDQALLFIHKYHFSLQARKRGDSITEYLADELYKTAVKNAQKYVINLLIDRNIGVETNPTSNYLIGPIEDFEDIPTLRMFGLFPGSEQYRDLRISIGSDDPGLFYTSLRNEYTSLYFALYNSKILNGNALISEIKALAQSSLELSFLK